MSNLCVALRSAFTAAYWSTPREAALARLDLGHFSKPSIRICENYDIFNLVKKSLNDVKQKHP
jgi:hypothetical protein